MIYMTITPTTTYAEILPLAETITVEELAELLVANHGVTIYPGPRKQQRWAWDASLSHGNNHVSFNYQDDQGNGKTGIADTRLAVYVFSHKRIVRVAS